MQVVHHAHLTPSICDGARCIVAADRRIGVAGFEVCVLTLDVGAHTAPLRHGGEMVVLSLSGCGKVLIDGAPLRFAGPCTLLIPPQRTFELANTGCEELQLVWVCSAAPTSAAEVDDGASG